MHISKVFDWHGLAHGFDRSWHSEHVGGGNEFESPWGVGIAIL